MVLSVLRYIKSSDGLDFDAHDWDYLIVVANSFSSIVPPPSRSKTENQVRKSLILVYNVMADGHRAMSAHICTVIQYHCHTIALSHNTAIRCQACNVNRASSIAVDVSIVANSANCMTPSPDLTQQKMVTVDEGSNWHSKKSYNNLSSRNDIQDALSELKRSDNILLHL